MSKHKILIVEDDQIIAIDIKHKLENLGYIIVGIARTGNDAIELCDSEQPDLILMDITLSGDIDGIETAEIVHEKYNVPIFFITAHTDEQTFNRALHLDPFGYIVKPISEINLKFSIEIALNKNKMNLKFAETSDKFKILYYNSNTPIQYISCSGDILLLNNISAKIMGGKPEDFIGKHIDEILPDISEELMNRVQRVIETDKSCDFEDEIDIPSGKKWYKSNFQPVNDVNGKIFAIQIISYDITMHKSEDIELRSSLEKFRNLSYTDSLTGLYNRRGFYSLTEQKLKNADLMKNIAVIFYADLDGLKMINDKFGHSAGDIALIDISKILVDSFRDTDIIARAGGDEFLILTLEPTIDIENIIKSRINKKINKYNKIKKYGFELSISIGSVNFEINSCKPIDEYISIADKKMYDVKHKKNRIKKIIK